MHQPGIYNHSVTPLSYRYLPLVIKSRSRRWRHQLLWLLSPWLVRMFSSHEHQWISTSTDNWRCRCNCLYWLGDTILSIIVQWNTMSPSHTSVINYQQKATLERLFWQFETSSSPGCCRSARFSCIFLYQHETVQSPSLFLTPMSCLNRLVESGQSHSGGSDFIQIFLARSVRDRKSYSRNLQEKPNRHLCGIYILDGILLFIFFLRQK